MRTCKCCGEEKPTRTFSWNQKRLEYSPSCRECGVWLRLLREVFGPTRDWDKNREQSAIRRRSSYNAQKSAATNNLYAVWGIGRVNERKTDK